MVTGTIGHSTATDWAILILGAGQPARNAEVSEDVSTGEDGGRFCFCSCFCCAVVMSSGKRIVADCAVGRLMFCCIYFLEIV